MALIRAEVQTIQDYLEQVKKSQDKRFWRRKMGVGEGGPSGVRPGRAQVSFPLLRRGFLPLEREFRLCGGDFACFLPKIHFSQKEGKPGWVQQGGEGGGRGNPSPGSN